MGVFFKNDIVINRRCDELLSELSALTILPYDRMNYGKEGEFRGVIWDNGFKIALNTHYWNSFESQATGYVEPLGNKQCVVHLSIGINPLILVLMCLWNLGLLVAIIAASISVFSDGTSSDFIAMLLFLPFIIADVVLLRFAIYSNYKKLKDRIFYLLTK